MALQAGQLHIVRRHLELEDGITTIDTGITQVNLGLSPDPPLGGSDPTADSDGVASRVMVVPQAPLTPWNTSNIHHSEPYLDPATNTVKVDFWVAAGTGPAEINVEFWDPHTVICPMDCDPYNVFACATPTPESGSGEIGFDGPPATLPNPATTGQAIFVFATVFFADSFDPADVITPDDAGWTTLRTANIDMGGGTGMQMAVFVRVAAGADPASYDFSWTSAGSNAWQLIPCTVTGANQTTPVQSDAPIVTNAVADTPFPLSTTSLTAVEPLPVALLFYVCHGNGGSWSTPPGTVPMVAYEMGSGLAAFLCRQTIAAVGPIGANATEYDAGADAGFAYAVLIAPECGIFPGDTPDPMDEMGEMGIMDIMGV